MEALRYEIVPSPVGPLLLAADDEALRFLSFEGSDDAPHPDRSWTRGGGLLEAAAGQLEEYFAGERTEFELPLDPHGTPFQRACWGALQEIPYGETRSYGDQARRIGRPRAFRAVGGANHRNPIAIIIPCHRVIGSTGALTGFGGGMDTKRFLLDLEQHSSRPGREVQLEFTATR